MLVPVDDSQALSDAMMQILNGDVTFDNKAIADYTQRTYSQEAINGEILNIFSRAIEECYGKNESAKKLQLTRKPSGPSLDDDL